MVDGIIERNESDSENVVTLGNSPPISMKLVQSIYNEITGKTEKLSQSLKDHHEINFEDIKQLNTKICQLYEQYKIVSKSCCISIYHIDDCKEQFSSFERFEMYDSGSSSPCENIHIKYDFLIVLPDTKKAQPYSIDIDIASRIGIRKKAESASGMTRRLIRLFATNTGSAEINYVDYTVARTFMTAIEHWYSSVKKNKSSKLLGRLQNKSEYFPIAFKIITSVIILAAFFLSSDKLFSETSTIKSLFSISLIAFGSIYILGAISSSLGSIFENAIDSHQAISGLRLNRGDENAIDEFRKLNLKQTITAIASVAIMIFINLFSTYLSDLLIKI